MNTKTKTQALPKEFIQSEINKVFEEAKNFRHELHENPELTWKEEKTAERIVKRLSTIEGLTVIPSVGKYGVVAVLDAGKGPTIALRADMDALPLQEENDLPYGSKTPGVMHACGHDGHVACLFGAAKTLSAMKDKLAGKVKFIFQPAEEGGAGADAMIKDGVLENPHVDYIYGLHGWTDGVHVGEIATRAGSLMASDTHFEITVSGVGCHAALPHLGTDQILIASRIVENLQSISSRRVSPVDPIAITITKFHGGNTINIIPAKVDLHGTLRCLDLETRDLCLSRIKEIARSTAEMNGAKAEVRVKYGYPVTKNDEAATKILDDVAIELLGRDKLLSANQTMGAEDFSYFLQNRPGSFFFLGLNDGSPDYPAPHHPKFNFNDDSLDTGMSIFVGLALKILSKSS